MALTSCGITVSSYPMMPGKSGSPASSFRTRLSRISAFTGRMHAPVCRRKSPSVLTGAAMNRFYYTGPGSGASGPSRFFASSAPRVFAHRGGALLAPENTMAAFDRGLEAGADGLELDVHLSRDGVVVVHHDRTLDRTTNECGPIAARTADELARADAGYRFACDGTFPHRGRGLGVPTLAGVLARYPGVPIMIEMKVNSVALAAAVVAVVRAADA